MNLEQILQQLQDGEPYVVAQSIDYQHLAEAGTLRIGTHHLNYDKEGDQILFTNPLVMEG